jgi:pilus assembly protein CpaF
MDQSNQTFVATSLFTRAISPLDIVLKNEEVNEVSVNADGNIFIEKRGKRVISPIKISPNQFEVMYRAISTIMKNEQQPDKPRLLDGHFKSGEYGSLRLAFAPQGIGAEGAFLSIRKASKVVYSLADFVANNTMTQEMANALAAYVREGKSNVLVCGGTASGKTSLCNALIEAIPEDLRIGALEDTVELKVPHTDRFRLLTNPYAGVDYESAFSRFASP